MKLQPTERTMFTYFTGVTHEDAEAMAARRADFGILATPAGGTGAKRDRYAAWAADNGFFTAPRPTGEGHEAYVRNGPTSATARQVRYADPAEAQCEAWLAWLSRLDPSDCTFATLPDVVGDAAATWERSIRYAQRAKALGFKVAFVLQDGVEHDRFMWGSILNAADAVFIGGSTDWKLSPAVAQLVAEAKARGLHVHMGRVNSFKRAQYAASIGCDSADGTFLKFCRKADRPAMVATVERWLDRINGTPTPALFEVAAA